MGRSGGFGSRGPSRGRGRGRGSLGPRGGGVPKKRGGAAGSGGGSNKHRSVKNQIRGVERLLKLEGLDPRIRAAKEAELAELQATMAQHQREEQERKFAVKYHRVKFFERIKLERSIRRLERLLGGCAGGKSSGEEGEEREAESAEGDKDGVPRDPEAIRAKLTTLKDDLMYVKHFPKGEKYVSILRDGEDPEAQKHLEAERERLRAIVRQQVAEVAAVTEADEGRALLGDKALAAQPTKAVANSKANVKAKAEALDGGRRKAVEEKPQKQREAKRRQRTPPAGAGKTSVEEEEEAEEAELLLDEEGYVRQEYDDDFFIAAGGGGGDAAAVAAAGGTSDSDAGRSDDGVSIEEREEASVDTDGEADEEAEAAVSTRAPAKVAQGDKDPRCRVGALGSGIGALVKKSNAAAPTGAGGAASGALTAAKLEGPTLQVGTQRPHKQQPPLHQTQQRQSSRSAAAEVGAKRRRHAFVVNDGGADGDEDEDDFFLPAHDDVGAAAAASDGDAGEDRENSARARSSLASDVRQAYELAGTGAQALGEEDGDDERNHGRLGGNDDERGERDSLDMDGDDVIEGPRGRQQQQQRQEQRLQFKGGRDSGSREQTERQSGRHFSAQAGRALQGTRGGRGSVGGFGDRGRGRGRGEPGGGRGGRSGSSDRGLGRGGVERRGNGGDRGSGADAGGGSGGAAAAAAERQERGSRGGGRGTKHGERGGGRRGGRDGGHRSGTPPRDDTQPLRKRAEGGRKRRKKGGSSGGGGS